MNGAAGSIVCELPPKRGNPRNSEGAFTAFPDGRLWFVWSRFRGGTGDGASADLAVITSRDQGCSWSRPRQLLANEGRWNIMSPSLLWLDNQRLGLFYQVQNSHHDGHLRLRTTSDRGSTWSRPTRCAVAPGFHIINNDRVVRLASGRLIVPAAFHRQRHRADAHGAMDLRGIVLFFLSDDAGRTWRESRSWWACPDGGECGLQEPGVIPLVDGRLFAWARTGLGRQYGLWSYDDGETWSKPTPTGFASPCSPLSMKRLPDGRLATVWNDHSQHALEPTPRHWGRVPLSLALSADDGASWSDPQVLEDDPRRGYSYAALHATSDDHLLIAYCAGDGSTGSPLDTLRIRRISLPPKVSP